MYAGGWPKMIAARCPLARSHAHSPATMTRRTLYITPLQRRIRLQVFCLPVMFLRLGEQVVPVHTRCHPRIRLCIFKVGAIAALVQELFGVVVGLAKD